MSAKRSIEQWLARARPLARRPVLWFGSVAGLALIWFSAGDSVLGFVSTLMGLIGIPYLAKQDPQPPRPARPFLDDYLDGAAKRALHLPIESIFDIGTGPAGAAAIGLDRIYVPLDLADTSTEELRRDELRELSIQRLPGDTRPVLQAIARAIADRAQHPAGLRAVLLSDAGGGKTSITDYLVWRARHPDPDQPAPDTWPESLRGRTVARLALNRVRGLIRRDRAGRPLPGQGHLALLRGVFVERIEQTLGCDRPTADQTAQDLLERLRGRGLLVLDGLDEVLDPHDRALVRAAIQDATAELGPNCAILVTARPYVYPHDALDGFTLWRLQPLSFTDQDDQPGQVGLMVRNWHRALLPQPTRADAATRGLIAALRADPDRRDMASRPLLLTLLIGVHLRRGERDGTAALPRIRADLLEDATQLLMQRWFERIDRDRTGRPAIEIPEPLRALLESGQLRDLAEQVSFEVQRHRRAGGDCDIEVSANEFVGALVQCLPNHVGLDEVRHRYAPLLWERTALWFPRGNAGRDSQPRLGYIHRQFQEYLAACRIEGRPDRDAAARDLAGRLRDNPIAWREVARLAVIRTARRQSAPAALHLVRRLLTPPSTRASAQHGRDYGAVLTAGLALLDLHAALDPPTLADTLVQRDLEEAARVYGTWFQRLVRDPGPTRRERLEAGQIAGMLGVAIGGEFADVRPGIVPSAWTAAPGQLFDPRLDDFDWVRIGRHCQISRYPVTQAQFAAFVRNGGYAEGAARRPAWWGFSEVARDWWRGEQPGLWLLPATPGLAAGEREEFERRIAQQGCCAPGGRRPPPMTLPNYPVTSVSWFEAAAYCRWLSLHLPLAPSQVIRLPTELEWEQAALGRVPASAVASALAGTARTLPDPGAAAVGLYAFDPDWERQAADLIGNVREWTANKWHGPAGPYTYPYVPDDGRESPDGAELRVTRGGPASGPGELNSLGHYRGRQPPDLGSDDLGFRILLTDGVRGPGPAVAD